MKRRPRQRRSGEIHTKSSAILNSSPTTPDQKTPDQKTPNQDPHPPARGTLAAVGGFGRKAWGRGLIALVSVLGSAATAGTIALP